MLRQNLRIDQILEPRNRIGLFIALENMIGVFEFQMIGQGQQVPTLMEEGPEIGPVREANILQNPFIQFKGGFLEIQREILMEQKPCQIGILRLQIQFIGRSPGLKEGKPGRPDRNMNILIDIILIGLFIGLPCVSTDESLADLAKIAKIIE